MHYLSADGRKGVFNLEIIKYCIIREDFLQQFLQSGIVPLPIAKIVNTYSLCFVRFDFKSPLKKTISLYNL